jgi:hypothetical protein
MSGMASSFSEAVALLKCCAAVTAVDILRAQRQLSASSSSVSPTILPSPESPVLVEGTQSDDEKNSCASLNRDDAAAEIRYADSFVFEDQEEIASPSVAVRGHITPQKPSIPLVINTPIFSPRSRKSDSQEAGAISNRESESIPCEFASAGQAAKLCIKSSAFRPNKSARGLKSKSCVLLVKLIRFSPLFLLRFTCMVPEICGIKYIRGHLVR